MKTIIVYKGKYGATAQYASWLGQELQAPVMESEDTVENNLKMYDNVIIGSSVYIGKLQIRHWLNRYAETLATKNVFFFIVCATRADETEKLAEIIDQNIPVMLVQPLNIFFLRGRVIKKNLSFSDQLMLKIGAMLQKNPADRANMLTDFDEVKRENLFPIIKAVQQLPKETQTPEYKGKVLMML